MSLLYIQSCGFLLWSQAMNWTTALLGPFPLLPLSEVYQLSQQHACLSMGFLAKVARNSVTQGR